MTHTRCVYICRLRQGRWTTAGRLEASKTSARRRAAVAAPRRAARARAGVLWCGATTRGMPRGATTNPRVTAVVRIHRARPGELNCALAVLDGWRWRGGGGWLGMVCWGVRCWGRRRGRRGGRGVGCWGRRRCRRGGRGVLGVCAQTERLSEDNFSYALGAQGSTRRKLATASGCILEVFRVVSRRLASSRVFSKVDYLKIYSNDRSNWDHTQKA